MVGYRKLRNWGRLLGLLCGCFLVPTGTDSAWSHPLFYGTTQPSLTRLQVNSTTNPTATHPTSGVLPQQVDEKEFLGLPSPDPVPVPEVRPIPPAPLNRPEAQPIPPAPPSPPQPQLIPPVIPPTEESMLPTPLPSNPSRIPEPREEDPMSGPK